MAPNNKDFPKTRPHFSPWQMRHYEQWNPSPCTGTPMKGGSIPKSWGTPLHGDEFPSTGAPQCMGMHSHLLGHPRIWECIPLYMGSPIGEYELPNAESPLRMYMHIYIYIYMYICLYVYIYIYVYVHTVYVLYTLGVLRLPLQLDNTIWCLVLNVFRNLA
jgi:hypothetical protein